MESERIRPSGFYYVLAGLIFLAGLSIFIYSLVSNISKSIGSVQQIVVPTTVDLNLDKVGKYTIFLESKSIVNGKVYIGRESASGLKFQLKEKSSGETVMLSSTSISSHYKVGGREGSSILGFSITNPGIYEFSALYDGASSGPQVVLGIARNFSGGLVSTILLSMAILFSSLTLSIVIAVVTYSKRRKYKKLMGDNLV